MKIISIEEFRNRKQMKSKSLHSQPPQEKGSEFPKPDRSKFKPSSDMTQEDYQLDIAWGEGTLSDGRPFRMECWAASQMTFLTYFMSTLGIENLTNEGLKELLEREQIVDFYDEKFRFGGFTGCNVDAKKVIDASENEMWSITIIIGDEDGTYANNVVPLLRYNKKGD